MTRHYDMTDPADRFRFALESDGIPDEERVEVGHDGKQIFVRFPDVATFGLDPAGARELARGLTEAVDRLEGKR